MVFVIVGTGKVGVARSYQLTFTNQFFTIKLVIFTLSRPSVIGQGGAEAVAVVGRVQVAVAVRVFVGRTGGNRRNLRLQAQSQLPKQKDQVQNHRRRYQGNASGPTDFATPPSKELLIL